MLAAADTEQGTFRLACRGIVKAVRAICVCAADAEYRLRADGIGDRRTRQQQAQSEQHRQRRFYEFMSIFCVHNFVPRKKSVCFVYFKSRNQSLFITLYMQSMHAYIRYTLLYGVIVALICRKIVKKRELISLNL